MRRKIFFKSLETIEKHNKLFDEGSVSFKLGVNKFADMSFEEFVKINTVNESVVKVPSRVPFKPVAFIPDSNATIPTSFDWRNRIALSRVKDQESCGSCYVMSTLDTIESQLMIKHGQAQELSVQEIIDCAGDYQTWGCDGGLKFRVYDYIADNEGISREEDYSYKAESLKCKAAEHQKLFLKIEDYGQVEDFDEELLKEALVTVGPISVSVDINHETFMRYSSGIYFDEHCTIDTNHAAVLVGYGSENGEEFWTIKNSFGKGWGEGGFFRLARNRKNHCGIATDSYYPILA